MNEEEKRLLDSYRRLRRGEQRVAPAVQLINAFEFEETAVRIARRSVIAAFKSLYAEREPVPMGAVKLAMEAANE
jgi:hypothetical protein